MAMRLPALQLATALALALGAGAAQAQGEKKQEEGKAPPAHQAPAPQAEKHPEKPHADKAHTGRAASVRERRQETARKRIEDKQKAAEAAQRRKSAPAAPALALSDEEQMIVLSSVNASSDSTLGLGLLSVGADVPRSIELHNFPNAVLDRVTKLKGYKYFSAEGRVAIVDPKQPRVVVVLGLRR
jgi:hypothetical protein